jgi:hypothetical protein
MKFGVSQFSNHEIEAQLYITVPVRHHSSFFMLPGACQLPRISDIFIWPAFAYFSGIICMICIRVFFISRHLPFVPSFSPPFFLSSFRFFLCFIS